MHIGALARRTGRSIHTIRWYESQRLIPGVRRDPQGRRVYVEQHVGWLDLLDRLRSTGMSIREVREYAVMVRRGEQSLKDRQKLLQAHRERVEARIRDMTESLSLIDRKIEFYGDWLRTGVQPPIPVARKRRQS
jgi:DNA-binding transcriptional MerR regulator